MKPSEILNEKELKDFIAETSMYTNAFKNSFGGAATIEELYYRTNDNKKFFHVTVNKKKEFEMKEIDEKEYKRINKID